MPASGVIKLADANIWLGAAFSDHLHHAKAKTWFEDQSIGICAFCRVTRTALLRHLTNSKIMGSFVQSQQDAWRNFDRLANDPRVVFLPEPPGLEEAFRRYSRASSPSRTVCTDAYLTAFALQHQAQLVTFDKGFGRFTGLDLKRLV